MLRPGDQRLLLDAVRPPDGYALDHALAMTYSLDLAALLSIPLALTFNDWNEEEQGARVDPIALLEAVRRHSDRLTVLCQAGEIALPNSRRNLFAFLEPVVRQVTAPGGGVFHPKVWVSRYLPTEDAGPVRYRVLVASRNLTFDRSWDALLVLDGELLSRRNRIALSTPFARFVKEVVELASNGRDPIDDQRRQTLATMVTELARVQFEDPEDLELVGFHPFGVAGASRETFAGRIDRILVISPFIGDSTLHTLSGPDSVLVSSAPELDCLRPDTLEGFAEVCVLRDLALAEPATEEEPVDSPDAGIPTEGVDDAIPTAGRERLQDSAAGLLKGLHAKLYVADAGHPSRIWIGSANATAAAFGTGERKNVELLVELRAGKTGKIASVLGDDESGLRQILTPYVATPMEKTDRDLREAEFLVDHAAHAIAELDFVLTASPDSTGEAYRLALSVSDGLADAGQGLEELDAWPVTLHPDLRVPLLHRPSPDPGWDGLAPAQLSAFLGLRLQGRVNAAVVERVVTVRGLLVDAPDDRDGQIMRSLLGSTEQLLRYLAFLLSDPDRDLEMAPELLELLSGGSAAEGNGAFTPQFPLFEALVRALDRDPGRIDRVASLIDDLARAGTGKDLIPDGFEEIWEPILEARRALKERRR